MTPIVFIDRDGTLLEEPPDFQIDAYEKLRFVAGVIPALLQLRDAGYQFVIVTNQDGLGSAAYPQASFDGPHDLMLHIFASQGIVFRDVLIDRSWPADNAPTRKPGIGLMVGYLQDRRIDWARSAMVGDRPTDLNLRRTSIFADSNCARRSSAVSGIGARLRTHWPMRRGVRSCSVIQKKPTSVSRLTWMVHRRRVSRRGCHSSIICSNRSLSMRLSTWISALPGIYISTSTIRLKIPGWCWARRCVKPWGTNAVSGAMGSIRQNAVARERCGGTRWFYLADG